MEWYTDSRCILLGSSDGLWLYDVDQPDKPLPLARLSGGAINDIAVNPIDSMIAFSVNEQPIVYLLNTDGTKSILQANGQAITGISFSNDGNWIAIASSDIGDIGSKFDARVQIWDLSDKKQIAFMKSDTGAIREMFFTPDNHYLLTDGVLSGYIGDHIEYWDTATASRVWDYNELWTSFGHKSADDPFPLLVLKIAMKGHNIAFGGLYGYMDYDEYYGHAIQSWDAELREPKFEIILSRRGSGEPEVGVSNLTFNSDGSVLVSSSSNGIVQFWKMTDGSEIDKFEIGQHEVDQIALSPNDRFLAILSDGEVRIWDVEKQSEYVVLPT
ncbi:MAG: hypothetical protein ABI690_03685 [Chloroflexota bacterium]